MYGKFLNLSLFLSLNSSPSFVSFTRVIHCAILHPARARALDLGASATISRLVCLFLWEKRRRKSPEGLLDSQHTKA
ncbi:hypothetical protein IE53DRAFT_384526 [Violaceomyces palustris]|uniref:Uncharacterized protein n=1 Tax=Violaceomyces palustris TaxID=1673888 RepID=A0ACD0P4X6_9BASI|nr:hypothetical protein IE53DRAFT_384526 [Violaceomyces palustris]